MNRTVTVAVLIRARGLLYCYHDDLSRDIPC
jgi:hypothetical protein